MHTAIRNRDPQRRATARCTHRGVSVRGNTSLRVGPPHQELQYGVRPGGAAGVLRGRVDRKSTRLNSSHANISYAVFCLKKKKKTSNYTQLAPLTTIQS